MQYLKPLTNIPWVVFAKRPFAGPSQILDYLGRYTHRVAIANGCLLDCQNGRVSFRWKDYRAQNKSKAMTLDANEFMRRFLMHVLPKGFRRIRHFGFLANACCVQKLARIRAALDVPNPEPRVKPKDYRKRYALLTGKASTFALARRSHRRRGFTAAPFAPTSKATMGQLMTPSSPTMSSRPTSVDMRAIQRRASANSRIVDRRRQYRPINPAKIVSSIQASRLSRSEPSQEGRLRLRRPPRAPRSTHLTNDQRP